MEPYATFVADQTSSRIVVGRLDLGYASSDSTVGTGR